MLYIACRKFIFIFLFMLYLCGGTQAFSQEKISSGGFENWNYIVEDVQPDPGVHYGRLANGLRYAIFPQPSPDGQVAFTLRIDGGHLAEERGETGAAHLLEHMAFRGSTSLKEGELKRNAERLGLSLGKDLSAITNWDDTIFSFVAQDNKEKTVSGILFLLREIASELTLSPEALERERPIVLNEIRLRLDQDRRWIRYVDAVAPGSPLGSFVIGDGVDVRTIDAPAVKRFYERTFRPDNAVLVIVGNVSVKDVEKQIEERFSDWTARAPDTAPAPVPVPVPVPVPANKISWKGYDPSKVAAFSYDVDPRNIDNIELSVTRPFPQRIKVDRPYYRRNIMDNLIGIALRSRLETALAAGVPVAAATGGTADIQRSHRSTTIAITPYPGGWADALSFATNQMQLLKRGGLNDVEVANAKDVLRNYLDLQLKASEPVNIATIANTIAGTSATGDPFTEARYTARLGIADIDSLTTAELNTYLQTYLLDGKIHARVALSSGIEQIKPEEAIASVLDRAVAGQMSFVTPDGPVTLLVTPHESGKITSDDRGEDGIRRVVFSNGVRLNIKRMEANNEPVAVVVNIGNGNEAVKGGRCLRALAPAILLNGGANTQPVSRLRAAASRSGVRYPHFSLNPTRLSLNAEVDAPKLNFIFQLATNYISSADFNPEAMALSRIGLRSELGRRYDDPEAMLRYDGILATHKNDHRLAIPDTGCETEPSLSEVQFALRPILEQGAIEIGIVGNVVEKDVIASVASTLATLPKRGFDFIPPWRSQMGLVDAGSTIRLVHKGDPEMGVVGLMWRTSDDRDIRASVARELVAAILQERIFSIVREHEGLTYRPISYAYASPYYKNLGFVMSSASGNPKDLDSIKQLILKEVSNINEVITDDVMVERIIKSYINISTSWINKNQYWIEVVSNAQSTPDAIIRIKKRLDTFNSISSEEIKWQAESIFYKNPIIIMITPSDNSQN